MNQILELYENKTINTISQAFKLVENLDKPGSGPKPTLKFLNKYINNNIMVSNNNLIHSLKTLEYNESSLNNLVLYERPNLEILNKLLNSDLLQIQNYGDKKYDNEKQFLEAYRVNNKDGLNKVVYKKSCKFGRVYPSKNLGAIGMRREIRGSIFNSNYCDIDIENCHPVIFFQLSKYIYNINCPNLEKYINVRKEILKEIQEHYGVERDQAKALIISLLYGGSFKDWSKRNNIKKDVSNFIKELNKELILIFDEIYKNNNVISELIKKKSI